MADVWAANVFEEALARGWRGELYLGEPVSYVGGCKVRRTIAAGVRYTSIYYVPLFRGTGCKQNSLYCWTSGVLSMIRGASRNECDMGESCDW